MEKKSFLLYFDMYPRIAALPPEQRGALLSALFEYADAEKTAAGSGDRVLEDHPDMTPETQMAFGFMKETIHRDTEKWREKHQRYQNAARRRWEQSGEQDAKKRPKGPNQVRWEPDGEAEIWEKYIN